MDVLFDVDGVVYRLPEPQATILAENLHRKGAAVAADIKDVLHGDRYTEPPIPLEGEAAEAVFHILNAPPWLETDADGVDDLYRAVAKIHKRRLEQE